MKIIGHRGAAGSELENTLASIEAAQKMGVYAIEFDIRKTKDDHLIICHDPDLRRVSGDSRRTETLTLQEIQKIPLLTGAHVPTLVEALEVLDSTRCLIEIKERGCVPLLLDVLKKFPRARVSIVSGKLDELAAFKSLSGRNYPLYGSEITKPFDIIHAAKRLGLDGVSLNYWLLNPVTYWLCKRAKLDILVWTVNQPFQARFLSTLYPDITIITDYPELFVKRRK